MHVADILSRAPTSSTGQHTAEKDSFDVMTVNYILHSLEELKKHTAEDTTLQTLSAIIRHEWSSKQRSLPHAHHPYFPFRNGITCTETDVKADTHNSPSLKQAA